ncbi:unnamed protein product [Caenorhabditis sp. 36 PRJEB53466]|nr:unnamed protein product [Caenorhabditis sp. 36 PRJEB53466]
MGNFASTSARHSRVVGPAREYVTFGRKLHTYVEVLPVCAANKLCCEQNTVPVNTTESLAHQNTDFRQKLASNRLPTKKTRYFRCLADIEKISHANTRIATPFESIHTRIIDVWQNVIELLKLSVNNVD